MPGLVHPHILTPGESQVDVLRQEGSCRLSVGVWCYQPRAVLLINPLDGTETPQGQIRENNNLLWCERGDSVGKQRENQTSGWVEVP